jgi:hypothetical protein
MQPTVMPLDWNVSKIAIVSNENFINHKVVHSLEILSVKLKFYQQDQKTDETRYCSCLPECHRIDYLYYLEPSFSEL